MFLLFQFLRYHHGFCFQDLHSNMFLLFLSSARRKRSLRQFTFQYVSIISDVSDLERKLLMRFTFQYVSIISVLPFFSFHFQSYLHSNMFLLFRITNSIYATYNHNLHSNMFLLFQLLVEQGYTDFENLHSNMFLLFLTSNLIKSLLDFIYIPICFYYFQDEHIFIENGISFTFQYVSIISLLSPRHSFLPEAHLHSNMFLLFRDFLFLLLSLPTYLHSNMFLLFPFCSLPVSVLLRHLHSNMFLLFLYIAERLILCVQNLHSIMFLLFRDTHFKDYLSTKEFTFQYVSIISA